MFSFCVILVSSTHLETFTHVEPQLSGLSHDSRSNSLLTPSTVKGAKSRTWPPTVQREDTTTSEGRRLGPGSSRRLEQRVAFFFSFFLVLL